MRCLRRFVLATSVAWLAFGSRVKAADEIGWTVRVAGAPVLQRARTVYRLGARDAVFEGDTVRTDQRSLAELMLVKSTRINLGSNSEIRIDRFLADLGGQIILAVRWCSIDPRTCGRLT